MNKTSIQWTDYTSNPIRYVDKDGKDVWACVKHSPGCVNCYAEAIAHRWKRGHDFTKANMEKYGIKPFLDPMELNSIRKYKPAAGKRCFIGDMTDIFGEWVSDNMLLELFEVMVARKDVTFQILTKRADRMKDWTERHHMTLLHESGIGAVPNIHLGVSVENDTWAEKRLQYLRMTVAAVKFVSYEPALGPVDWDRHFGNRVERKIPGQNIVVPPAVNWIIIGGESGHGARPFDIQWAFDTVAWCKDNGVACFFKQAGSRPHFGDMAAPNRRGEYPWQDRSGGDPDEWTPALRVREFPCPKP